MNRNNIIAGCLGILVLALVAGGVYLRNRDAERISELESQLDDMREHEKQSAVDRRISKQMEEIAYGQQALSEERSYEAIRQSEIAQEMTLRSESERQKAIKAQAAAEMSAEEALTSFQLAERQRMEADKQRHQAEHAKLVADTLNYISLGRTLGSASYDLYRAGETEVGNMLAYAAYLYTSEYDGDLYIPAIFQALTQASGGAHTWNVHNGSISRVDIMPKDKSLITISTYGEIFIHRIQDKQIVTRRVMSDKNYCFRDLYATKNGKGYVVSHTGHLVVVDGDKTRVIYVENVDKPFSLQYMNDGNQLLIIGEHSIALLDTATDRIIGSRRLGFQVTCTSRRDYKPLLFDSKGRMHLVSSLDDLTDEKVPVPGRVTTFAGSKNAHLNAYGMADGTIWLIDDAGRTHRLVGHLSQITKMKFSSKLLYTSSYDGKLLFWMTSESQIKPITLFQSNSWLTDFTFSSDKHYIWTGEHNGTLTQYLINLPMIAQRIREKVKRNFTKEEWDYYIGKGIPYRKLKN